MSARPSALVLLAAIAAPATAAAAPDRGWELGLYGGMQGVARSDLSIGGDGALPASDLDAGWTGESFEAPPYYGLRATWWADARWGVGLDFTHAKAAADDATRAAAGLDTLEFTNGINTLTVTGWRRWPGAGPVTPYLGLGAGVAVPHVEVRAGDDRTRGYQLTGPAVSAVAGASYALDENWSVFGEVKGTYSWNEADLDTGGTLETDLFTRAVNLGVSYRF